MSPIYVQICPSTAGSSGYPAKRFVLTLSDEFIASCGGPERRWLWENASGSHFGLLHRGTATIYVVDVDGDRLVITSHYRGASTDDIAELDAIVASIDMEPSPWAIHPEPLSIGWVWLTADGVSFSFRVPTPAWERFDSISINKSTVGPQGAEGIIYWTTVPDGAYADPCADPPTGPVGPSAADLAAVVSTTPGTQLLTGPADVILGGCAAKHMVLTVREDIGCDPGFFHTWQDSDRGAFWPGTGVGDTLRVWIVDVDGKRLLMAGATKENAGPELEQEILQIVDSIRFE